MSDCTGTTKDLNKSEELVLVRIALNPDKTGEELKNKLNTDVESFSDCIDTLLARGYVALGSEEDENNWRITELGRMALEKFATVLEYDVVYAKRTEVDEDIKRRVNKKKMMFQRALNSARKREEDRRQEGKEDGPQ